MIYSSQKRMTADISACLVRGRVRGIGGFLSDPRCVKSSGVRFSTVESAINIIGSCSEALNPLLGFLCLGIYTKVHEPGLLNMFSRVFLAASLGMQERRASSPSVSTKHEKQKGPLICD